jgi:hypothetical protein
MEFRRRVSQFIAVCLMNCVLLVAQVPAEPPPDRPIVANARLSDVTRLTDADIGYGQGVSLHDGNAYVYGDNPFLKPRVGVISEYTISKSGALSATGRRITLSKRGRTVSQHPTGLTWDERLGCFLGDTVDGVATIRQIDWRRALADGTLDCAILATIRDDACINGCRPEFVTLAGKRLLATADYGDITPRIRLYDVERMLAAGKTSAPGVVVAQIACGPYNQNLHWNEAAGTLVCVQNAILGRGWRLDYLDLAAAVKAKNANALGVRIKTETFLPHDELEGYRPLAVPADDPLSLFIISSPRHNLITGRIEATEPTVSPPAGPRD